MERSELIQTLIDRKKLRTYLEIGVSGGVVFFQIKCKKKIAVDPFFRFNWKGKLGEISRNITNWRNSYFEIKSDEFFSRLAPSFLRKKKIDICLIDGMHEFRYALNDVINTLDYLDQDGIIIMHDCNPQTAEAECSFSDWEKRGFTGLWNGDVWKVIVYLRALRNDLNIFVADCDHGLGVITRGKNENPLQGFKSFEEIDALSYKDLESNRTGLLNLKSVSYLNKFYQNNQDKR